jgi:hypothetical protein
MLALLPRAPVERFGEKENAGDLLAAELAALRLAESAAGVIEARAARPAAELA